MSTLVICLIIFVLTLVGFCVNLMSIPITGMVGMMCMILAGCLSPAKTLGIFANANAVLMASMFIVAAGLNRTQMVNKVSGYICRVSKGSFYKVLGGYVLLTCLLVQFIPSAMVAFSIVFPMVLAVCKELHVNPSKMMYSIGITAIGTVVTLPVGSAITNLAQFNGFLEAFSYTDTLMELMDIFYGRIFVLIFIVLYAIFVAPRLAPDIDFEQANTEGGSKLPAQEKLPPHKEFIGYVTFICVLVGLLFPKVIGIPGWLLALFGAIVLAAFKVLSPSELLKEAHPGIIVLYLSTIGLGTALTDTGAGTMIGNSMSGIILTLHSNYLAGFLLFIVPFVLCQFMNNYSIFCIFVPLYIMICKSLGCNPVGPLLLTLSSCLTAFMTPMATPTVPLMMGVSGYTVKDLFRMSLLPAAIICIVSVACAMTLYPIF